MQANLSQSLRRVLAMAVMPGLIVAPVLAAAQSAPAPIAPPPG